jgi:1,4-alpha-glucan branching enzyme
MARRTLIRHDAEIVTELHVAQLASWTPDLGATVLPAGEGVSFCVCAPVAQRVDVEVLAADGSVVHSLHGSSDDGEFEGVVCGIGAGTRYRFRLDGSAAIGPCSRSQPEKPPGRPRWSISDVRLDGRRGPGWAGMTS